MNRLDLLSIHMELALDWIKENSHSLRIEIGRARFRLSKRSALAGRRKAITTPTVQTPVNGRRGYRKECFECVSTLNHGMAGKITGLMTAR